MTEIENGAKPELDSRWWIQNKAKTFNSQLVTEALQAYEVAIDRMDYLVALSKLANLKEAVANDISQCDDSQGATKACLLEFDKLIVVKEKEIAKKIKDDAARTATAHVAPNQIIGKDVEIWRRDFGFELLKQFHPDWIEPMTGWTLQLKLNDDILDVLDAEDDLVTPQFMQQDVEEAFQRSIANLVKKLKTYDPIMKERKSLEGTVDVKTQILEDIDREYKSLEKLAVALPKARWEKFVARNKQYAAYKLQMKKDFAIGTIGVRMVDESIVGGALVGSEPTIVAIIGAANAITNIVQKSNTDLRSAATIRNVLTRDLETLQKRYMTVADEAKKTTDAKEMLDAVIGSALNSDPPFIASLSNASKNLQLFKDNVAHLGVAAHGLGQQFKVILDALTVLERNLTAAGDSKEAVKLLPLAKNSRDLLTVAFEKAAGMNKRVENADKAIPLIDQVLESLCSANPDYTKIFDQIFPEVTNLFLSETGGTEGVVGFGEFTMAEVSALTGQLNDLYLSAKDDEELKGK